MLKILEEEIFILRWKGSPKVQRWKHLFALPFSGVVSDGTTVRLVRTLQAVLTDFKQDGLLSTLPCASWACRRPELMSSVPSFLLVLLGARQSPQDIFQSI